MKKTFLIYLLLILPAFFIISCSEESAELEALENLNIHQPGVLDPASPNFHGKFFVQKNMKFTDCQKCHGKNLDGGITMAKSCNECHSLATIHLNLTGIQDSVSSNFHGRYLLQHSLAECGQCHGKDYSGGSSSPSCATSDCHVAIVVHKTALLDTASGDFHGKFPLVNKFSQCQSCHGQNFAGGISSPSCATCHKSIDIHKDGIVDTTSANFHGKYLLKDGLVDCSSCHGANFDGGFQSPKCTDCHSTITVHQAGIVTKDSPEFHGKYPLAGGKFTECQSCHGNNFQGGVNSPSCATTDCHKSIDVHKDGIVDPASANFHGKYQFKDGLKDCSPCHGPDFNGGEQSPACTTCHSSLSTHKAGIIDPNSPDFHGKYPLAGGKFTECQSCHGDNFQGKGISPSCTTCHKSIDVHKTGIVDQNSANFHGKYKLKEGFDDCSSCHGATFTGGIQSPSCATCHSTITVHKAGIVDQNSPDFHGKYPLAGGKFTECQTCHGDNFQGGLNSPSCATCHASIDVHKTGIIDQNSANFHGKYILKSGFSDCTSCHGTSFTGGSQSPTCVTCHSTIDVHKTGIVDQNSPNFHGKYQLKNGFTECKTCHGDNFQGGTNAVACASCHVTITVHKTGLTDPNSSNFHGKFLKANSWNMTTCANCHGSSFSGGLQSPSCKTSGCHTSAQGPAACNTCHGDFNNPAQISPPKDLNGNTSTSSPGVGAHVKHLAAFANGISLSCSECHTVPADVNAPGHLGGDGKAELNFGTFSNKLGGSSYDFGTNKCANTYCHGNFEFNKADASPVSQNQYTADKMVGNKRAPQWTLLNGSEVKCSSCHGKSDTDPSPIGHVAYTIDQCVWCHSNVVDASGTIIDKTRHINGKANVFGTKFRK